MKNIQKISETACIFETENLDELKQFLSDNQAKADFLRKTFNKKDGTAYFVNYVIKGDVKVFCTIDGKQANTLIQLVQIIEAIKPLPALFESLAYQFSNPKEIMEMIMLTNAFHECTALENENKIEENDIELRDLFKAQESAVETLLLELSNIEANENEGTTEEHESLLELQEGINNVYNQFGTLYPLDEEIEKICNREFEEILNLAGEIAKSEREKIEPQDKFKKDVVKMSEKNKEFKKKYKFAYRCDSLGRLLGYIDKTSSKGIISKDNSAYFFITNDCSLSDFLTIDCSTFDERGKEKIEELEAQKILDMRGESNGR